MLPVPVAQAIAASAYALDRETRRDLAAGAITSENDYTSNLTARLRLSLGPFPHLTWHYSRRLGATEEQRFGCDALLMFAFEDKVKIGMFEGKWPRYFQKPAFAWDSLRKDGRSRFTSQIDRQHAWKEVAAVWEMFYNESAVPGSPLPWDPEGSACVWHEDAHQFDLSIRRSQAVWSNADLGNLLRHVSTRGKAPNLYDVILALLTCREGRLHAFSDSDRKLSIRSSEDESEEIPLPPAPTGTQEDDARIRAFMAERGLASYTFVRIGSREPRHEFQPPKEEGFSVDLGGSWLRLSKVPGPGETWELVRDEEKWQW